MIHLKDFWRTIRRTLTVFILGTTVAVFTCQAINPPFVIKHLGDGQSIVQIDEQKKFLLLPVEEASPEAKLYMIADNDVVRSMNVRLAVNKVDYFVPVDLTGFDNKHLSFNFQLIPDSALCWEEMKLSDEFDVSNREKYRPVYHFSPAYGWMNDPNGMFYKDGVYHLFYQHNPYGSMWGNMHWGHATSTDLVTWEHHGDAISPDALGTIFSGSCVVDKDNTAGFGAGAVIAFYTSASDRQVQSMAYSLDNGKTFKKYARNPILTSTQRDFRDPKVIWHEDTKKWIMVLAVGQEMEIYSSADLKSWTLESKFGEGQGAHGGVWECPDLLELPVEGTELKKWVLVCNLNPGGPFGGSATQYFVGTFDGKRFVNESPAVTKWMDWGKDHYATVTFSNLGERIVAVPWMSNWQYANITPIRQYRGANALPRELKLFSNNGETYLSANVVDEARALRKETKELGNIEVTNANPYIVRNLFNGNNGAFEIEANITPGNSDVVGLSLFNDKEERTLVYLDLKNKRLVMDRTESGLTDFGKEAERHNIEKAAEAAGLMKGKLSQDIAANYKNDFALATWAPLSLCGTAQDLNRWKEDGQTAKEGTYHLDIFVDKCSVEVFVNGGRIAMTNLVFPTAPYNNIKVWAEGGKAEVSKAKVYSLGL